MPLEHLFEYRPRQLLQLAVELVHACPQAGPAAGPANHEAKILRQMVVRRVRPGTFGLQQWFGRWKRDTFSSV